MMLSTPRMISRKVSVTSASSPAEVKNASISSTYHFLTAQHRALVLMACRLQPAPTAAAHGFAHVFASGSVRRLMRRHHETSMDRRDLRDCTRVCRIVDGTDRFSNRFDLAGRQPE
jgi:hypothetical protein